MKRNLPEEITSKPVVKEGYLIKKSFQNKKTWNYRWFILREGYLIYARNEHSKEPRGIITLFGCTVAPSTKKKFCFTISIDEMTYYLCAATEIEQSDWMEVMQQCTLRNHPKRRPFSHTDTTSNLDSATFSSLDPISKMWGIALHDFEAANPTELPFKKLDVIRILKVDKRGWCKGEINGQVGWFPTSFVQTYDPLS